MKKIYLFLIILICCASHAQIIEKKEVNNDLKLSSLPYYSYGKGLGITSADSIFKLNIRFRMQNRVTFIKNESENTKYEAHIRRLRLRLDGYVGNPNFLYVLQLSFAPGDIGQMEEGKSINIIRDAALIYRPNKNWSFTFGQTKLPGNRQRINSSGALQLSDRSINNARFNIDRDFGVQAYFLNEKKEDFSYNIKTAVSSGQGRNWTGKESNSYALTGRVELFPFGTFSKGGEYFEGDLAREKNIKAMLSGTYYHNNNAKQSQGQLGNKLFQEKNFNGLLLDVIAKYQGWAGMFAYMNRISNDPITYESPDNVNSNFSYVYAGKGMDFQMSYIFHNDYEIIGRLSNQKLKKELFQKNIPNTTQYSIGVTKYLWEHAFKIQSEFTIDQLKFYNGQNKNNWYFRLQFEIGI